MVSRGLFASFGSLPKKAISGAKCAPTVGEFSIRRAKCAPSDHSTNAPTIIPLKCNVNL